MAPACPLLSCHCPPRLPAPPPLPVLQIYVEIERARLTRQLARMKEEEGAVQEAAEILQEVAVVSEGVGGWVDG